jgi:UDP-N-acetylglucosamine diphosphorylase/glucosamine-1-phosphate N-acetyltransferase
MVETICIFEGSNYSKLLPLVYFRPVYDLRCGILTLREKVEHQFPGMPLSLHCREYLTDVVKDQNPKNQVNRIDGESCLFINGQLIVDNSLREKISLEDDDAVYINGNNIVAAILSGSNLQTFKESLPETFTVSSFKSFPKKEIDAGIIIYPWDLVNNNGSQISLDFNLLNRKNSNVRLKGTIYEGATLLNQDEIFIGEGSKIKPGVVLDAESGPIYIGKNVTIYPNAVIEGPSFIGDESKIKIGAKIYENTSIGPVCKVGGEVEASIIHSHSNKQHDGFLGHSYIGMWTNLGADTNNSDLKNNYSNVRVFINGEEVDSNSMFVGLIMGDHSKCGINTMFNTGTVVGVSCNVFGSGYPSKYLPSFSWGGSESVKLFDLEKSIQVAAKVMQRRKIEMTNNDENLFRKVFELTMEERKKLGIT